MGVGRDKRREGGREGRSEREREREREKSVMTLLLLQPIDSTLPPSHLPFNVHFLKICQTHPTTFMEQQMYLFLAQFKTQGHKTMSQDARLVRERNRHTGSLRKMELLIYC
jgi:hypothetical protein